MIYDTLIKDLKDHYELIDDEAHPEIQIEIDDDGNFAFMHLPKDLEPMAEALGWERDSWWGSPCG